VLDPIYPFLTVKGSGPFSLDLYTEDIMRSGDYEITLTVSLPEFPEIAPKFKRFWVKLICNILSVSVPSPPTAYTTFKI
jgi:hypothetical protein